MTNVRTRIRPVSDLRNQYPSVEKDLREGPVFLTKNGYGDSVLISIADYDQLTAKLNMCAKIAQAEREFDEGKGRNAFDALRDIRGRLNV